MEIPRLGSNWSYRCRSKPQPQPQQHQIQATSVNLAAACSNAGSLTCWARPGIEPAPSWIRGGFLSASPQQKLPSLWFFNHSKFYQALWGSVGGVDTDALPHTPFKIEMFTSSSAGNVGGHWFSSESLSKTCSQLKRAERCLAPGHCNFLGLARHDWNGHIRGVAEPHVCSSTCAVTAITVGASW